ncbi:NAD(P)-dependent alcohol dehydrogenase, partial [Klebsiella pneumoniae]|nr:NAD(P)-dependent alcohol dehydrogenase [Klebsiella pneumoniae]
GVVGSGGRGQMGITLAHATGAPVVALTPSEATRTAASALGAADGVVSRTAAARAAHVKRVAVILNPGAAPHPREAFTTLLPRD